MTAKLSQIWLKQTTRFTFTKLLGRQRSNLATQSQCESYVAQEGCAHIIDHRRKAALHCDAVSGAYMSRGSSNSRNVQSS
eukprot:6172422-Pleurochrysis_carterae.AAC.1